MLLGRLHLRRRSEVLLWICGCLLVGVAAARLGAYYAFQSKPALLTHLSVAVPSRAPLCRLKVPRLGIDVSVLEGDDDSTLALAPGHVPDSAAIGGRGNSVIAGHRDVAFRELRFIKVGDAIEVEGTQHYRYVVTGIRIVAPDDVSVLAQTPESRLTVITCFPFYLVGNAPKRFVVQAVKVSG